jgi:hypothetical protein
MPRTKEGDLRLIKRRKKETLDKEDVTVLADLSRVRFTTRCLHISLRVN